MTRSWHRSSRFEDEALSTQAVERRNGAAAGKTRSWMHKTMMFLCFNVIVLHSCVGFANAELAGTGGQLFIFNSDGGTAAVAHTKGAVTREIMCHELDELAGTPMTDLFWYPNVGGNVFIYPTSVGERMGDNIRDWDKVHPYCPEQGRTMADNLRQLIEHGDGLIKLLATRDRELNIRFWLIWRMNEIQADDDRSPCLFPPEEETNGAPLLTDFTTKL